MELKVIAYARNGHTDKFGIPRQSREDSPILTRIVFEPQYSVREAFRGIEEFSHLWLLWGFSRNTRDRAKCEGACMMSEEEADVWRPTVRPPRLGGNARMGVFATRSPFRPNAIGMSSVCLREVFLAEEGPEKGRMVLIVSGADVLDGTPIYDIKPYLSFSDSHAEARNGFAQRTGFDFWNVQFVVSTKPRQNHDKTTTKSYTFSEGSQEAILQSVMPDEKTWQDIVYILSQDPCPAYQNDPDREYKMDYAGWRVTFSVRNYAHPAADGAKGVVQIKMIEKCA